MFIFQTFQLSFLIRNMWWSNTICWTWCSFAWHHLGRRISSRMACVFVGLCFSTGPTLNLLTRKVRDISLTEEFLRCCCLQVGCLYFWYQVEHLRSVFNRMVKWFRWRKRSHASFCHFCPSAIAFDMFSDLPGVLTLWILFDFAEISLWSNLNHIRHVLALKSVRGFYLARFSLSWREWLRRHRTWGSRALRRWPFRKANRFFQKNHQVALDCGIHQWLHWRTNRFWAWHVSHHDTAEHPVPQPIDPKDFILGTIRLSSWGFLLKVNGGSLTKTVSVGEWRWQGGLQREERLPDGRIVYSIETLQEVV